MKLVGIVKKLPMEGLPVLLHFHRCSLNERICSERLLPTEEEDILKQIQELFCTKGISAQLQSRFSATDHRDGQFREESLEKATVHFQEAL
jgi:hypothetical protein